MKPLTEVKVPKLSINNIHKWQHVALARLHLKLTGNLHQGLSDFHRALSGEMSKYITDPESGLLNPLSEAPLKAFAQGQWAEVFGRFDKEFNNAREQAIRLSIAALPFYHKKALNVAGLAKNTDPFTETPPPDLARPVIDLLISKANDRSIVSSARPDSTFY